MLSIKSLILSISLLLSLTLTAQLEQDFFPLKREYKPWGFIVSPELNKQFVFMDYNETITFNDTTTYQYNLKGSSKVGYGGEVGAFYTFKKPSPFHFVETTLGYRKLSSTTSHEGTLNAGDSIAYFASDNQYNQQLLHLSIRATHVLQLKRYSMVMNSIGVNANYNISESVSRSSVYPNVEERFTGNPAVQLNYQLGFGYRISKYVILAPSIETSLLTFYPFENITTGFTYFNQEYQPFYLKLRILILQKDPVNCNAPSYKGPAHLN